MAGIEFIVSMLGTVVITQAYLGDIDLNGTLGGGEPSGPPQVVGTPSWAGDGNDNLSGLSFSHAADAGGNGLVVIAGVVDDVANSANNCTATYAGQPMTRLTDIPATHPRSWPHFASFLMLNPPSGTNQVAVACDANTLDSVQAAAIDISGVTGLDAVAAVSGGVGTSDTPALATAAANTLVIAVEGVRTGDAGQFVWASPATELLDLPSTNGPGADITMGVAHGEALGGPVSMPVSWSPNNNYGHLIFSLLGGGGGGGGGANAAPVAVNDFALTDVDTPLVLSVAGDLLANDTDPDQDPLSLAGFTQPANGAVVDNLDGTLTYTPGSGFEGPDGFDYTVSDGDLTDTGTVSITVGGSSTIDLAQSHCFTNGNSVVALSGSNSNTEINPTANRTFDARGQSFIHWHDGEEVIDFRFADSTCIVGATVDGLIGAPDGSGGIFGDYSGDGVAVYDGRSCCSPTGQDGPDERTGHYNDGIRFHADSTGPMLIHGASIVRVSDAIAPPTLVTVPREVVGDFSHIYFREVHDELVEADACEDFDLTDSLADSTHVVYSARPGGSQTVILPANGLTQAMINAATSAEEFADLFRSRGLPVIWSEDNLIRQTCQPDDRDGRGGAPASALQSCPGTSPKGTHSAAYKWTPRCRTSNGIDLPALVVKGGMLRMDSVDLNGVDGMDYPANSWVEDHTLIYLGHSPGALPMLNVPHGPGHTQVVTCDGSVSTSQMCTDTSTADALWEPARAQWLAEHGCDANGDNCAFLAAP